MEPRMQGHNENVNNLDKSQSQTNENPESVQTGGSKKKKKSSDFIIPRTIFRRCIRDVLKEHHITQDAVDIVQSETETHMINYFSKVARVAKNCNRETILLDRKSVV